MESPDPMVMIFKACIQHDLISGWTLLSPPPISETLI